MNDVVHRASPHLLPPDIVARFAAIVGREHAFTDPDQQLPYLREWRDKYEGRSALVLRPGYDGRSGAHHGAGARAGPRGGAAGRQYGARRRADPASAARSCVSVARLNHIRHVDPAGISMTVEAALTLAEVQAAADKAGRLFPLSLPSEGSCRIGGNLGTNAGGVGVLAYGNTRQLVLGLEVVLADGRVWNGLKALKKDNTGYDLQGSVHRLGRHARHHHGGRAETVSTAGRDGDRVRGVGTHRRCARLFSLAGDDAGPALTAFEFIQRLPLEAVLAHMPGARDPFPTTYPWYVLMEVSGLRGRRHGRAADGAHLRPCGAARADSGCGRAQSLAQARDFWRLRESVSEAQKPQGGVIKHDISVPVARIPEFVRRSQCAGGGDLPRRAADGHRPLRRRQHPLQRRPAAGHGQAGFPGAVGHDDGGGAQAAVEMEGSISAEHGIGFMKREELPASRARWSWT